MTDLYSSIMTGLEEAIAEAQGKGEKLHRHKVTVEPVKLYTPAEIREIRTSTGMSQRLFAAYLGVSKKTVEAWESGANSPSGPSSRLLSILERDRDFIRKYPFVIDQRS